MEIIIFIVILLLIAAPLLINEMNGASEKFKAILEKEAKIVSGLSLEKNFDFTVKASKLPSLYLAKFLMSDDHKKLYILTPDSLDYKVSEYIFHVIDIQKIHSVEIAVDEETVTRTARGSQALGAAVGVAFFGGVGAVIGGLSGKKISTKNISAANIKIHTNDFNNPIYTIKIWGAPFGDAVKEFPLIHEKMNTMIRQINIAMNES